MTGLLIGCLLLCACANVSGFVTPAEETSDSGVVTLPAGGNSLSESIPAAVTPLPLGGYPAPVSDDSESLTQAKAATAMPGGYAMYLPLIANQMPSSYPFELQSSGVFAIQGMNDCDWSGVGGQVFDLAGAPLPNLILHLEGTWDGASVVREALSGSSPDPYGPAGYEFVLGDSPLDSSQALWIQVRDATGKQISERVYFNTYADCSHNLVLINFNQVR
jgi:hypothetical protein